MPLRIWQEVRKMYLRQLVLGFLRKIQHILGKFHRQYVHQVSDDVIFLRNYSRNHVEPYYVFLYHAIQIPFSQDPCPFLIREHQLLYSPMKLKLIHSFQMRYIQVYKLFQFLTFSFISSLSYFFRAVNSI